MQTRTKLLVGAGSSALVAVLAIVGVIIVSNYSGEDGDTTAENDVAPEEAENGQIRNGDEEGGNGQPQSDDADSVSTLPPPTKLTLDYSDGGQVKLRSDGNLELRGKNVPYNFGEQPSTARPAAGDRSVVIPGPTSIGTDSTRCKANQYEYRRRADGRIEIVTRDCTRITRWQ